MINCATFENVSREVYNKAADRIDEDKETFVEVTTYYNGTSLYGTVTIKARSGADNAYNKALQMFIEEFCK